MSGNTAMLFHADFATDDADMDSLARCRRALELALTNHGNPSVDVDQVLANDPQFVLGHCLRAARLEVLPLARNSPDVIWFHDDQI
jgi:hypothetical protein